MICRDLKLKQFECKEGLSLREKMALEWFDHSAEELQILTSQI